MQKTVSISIFCKHTLKESAVCEACGGKRDASIVGARSEAVCEYFNWWEEVVEAMLMVR